MQISSIISLFISLEIYCFRTQSTVNICIAGLNHRAGYATGWNIINELLNKKFETTSSKELIIHHNKINDDKDIANEFNIFFCKIGPRLAENIPRSHLDPLYHVTPQKNFQI